MTAKREESKARRRYDGSGRQVHARARREAILDHAQNRFLAHGYLATTVESIAAAAGVSAAMVYKTYGGKAGLVRELCARALAGEGPVPAHARSDAMREATDDPRVVVREWARLLTEVSPRFSPLLLLLAAAAEGDRDAAAVHAELDADRLQRMALNAEYLRERGHLRTGVSVEEARDVLWLVSSPELYELLVVVRGWPVERFGEFCATTMVAALLH
jgi:AcrR family transcriptional regulator